MHNLELPKKVKNLNQLFICASLIYCAISLIFVISDKSVDLQYHDTYFVIALWHFSLLFCIIFILMWAINRLFIKLLRLDWLVNIHVLLTVMALTLFFLITITHFSNFWFRPPGYTIIEMDSPFKSYKVYNSLIIISFLCFAIAQTIFILNLLLGLFHYLFFRKI